MALPHIGSWEYGGAFLATQGLPMTAVAERIEPPELFDYFVEQRAAMGLTIVPLDHRSGGTLMTTLRNGGLVGLLCDRDIEGTGIEVEFFGETTTMPAGSGHAGPPQWRGRWSPVRSTADRDATTGRSWNRRSTPPGPAPCVPTSPG